MALSNEWTDWHLTPRGWIAGYTKLDHADVERSTPDDQVLTMCWHEYCGAMGAKFERYHTTKWESTDADRIKELKGKFGECPDRLQTSN